MEPSDRSLELLIFKAAPQLGMLVKRATLYHWFTGRNGISPKMYPPVKAFIQTKLFRQRVPEARAFLSDGRTAILEVGQLIAVRGYVRHPRERRHRALRRLHGYHYSASSHDRSAVLFGGFQGSLRIDYTGGYDCAVFAALDHRRNATFAGYIFHDVTDREIGNRMTCLLPAASDIYVLDGVECASRRPVHQIFWYCEDARWRSFRHAQRHLTSATRHWIGERVCEPGSAEGFFAGPFTRDDASEDDETERQTLDTIIWDVAIHGITKP